MVADTVDGAPIRRTLSDRGAERVEWGAIDPHARGPHGPAGENSDVPAWWPAFVSPTISERPAAFTNHCLRRTRQQQPRREDRCRASDARPSTTLLASLADPMLFRRRTSCPTGAHGGVRWRRSCYPAVTPAVELRRCAFHDRGRRRCSSPGRAALQAPPRSEDRAVTYM